MNGSNPQGHFGSNPSYRNKAVAMKLAPFAFAKKEEDGNDSQSIAKVNGGSFMVENEKYLAQKGFDLKPRSKTHLGTTTQNDTSAHNMSVESFHDINISKDLSKMSISGEASTNLSQTYTTTPLVEDSEGFKVPASKNMQKGVGNTKAPTIKAQRSINQERVGIENPSNMNVNSNWDDLGPVDNRRAQSAPEDSKEDDRNEVKLEDLKQVGDLGSGSQGHVKKMIHKPTGTVIALKIVDLHTDDNFLKALKTEINTLQDCNSEYIVKCYGAYLTGGSISIALEYMDKGSLADLLKKVGVISEPVLGMITYQVLKGMEYLHKNMKVIHRDIKPSNLLINSEGQVKIADFGVSGKIEFTLQYKSTWVGTLPYMSPERCRGEKYNFDTDLWSLGLTILECALGRYPYSEIGNQSQLTFFDLVDILSTKPAPTLPDTYSSSLKDFVSICLRKEANTRTTATELLRHDFVKKYAAVKRDKFKGWLSTI